MNLLTLVTEFAAIALAVQHMGISPSLGVPLAAIGLVMLVLSGGYLRWERTTICLCLLDLTWLLLAWLVQPNWRHAVHDTLIPHVPPGAGLSDFDGVYAALPCAGSGWFVWS